MSEKVWTTAGNYACRCGSTAVLEVVDDAKAVTMIIPLLKVRCGACLTWIQFAANVKGCEFRIRILEKTRIAAAPAEKVGSADE